MSFRIRILVLGAAMAVSAGLAAPAVAEDPEQTVTLSSPPDGTAGWTGTPNVGANQSYDSASGEPCGDTPEEQCETILLHVNVPAGFWNDKAGGVKVDLTDYTVPTSDFDLYLYEVNPDGSRGKLIDSSGGLPGAEESAEIPKADGDYLIQVVYFAVTGSSYTGTASFVIRPARAPVPPDVDNPPGIQDSLASNPSLGYRSHSEPHIAQSPLDPNLLIAASKQYNRDPDSLAEYEFKIGTYVSFDHGETWTDLGQTDVCPADQAPPESWPNNDCYPEDDPNVQGTGGEDPGGLEELQEELGEAAGGAADKGGLGDIGEDDEGAPDQTRGSDYGEEYITSDAWVQFDDEGNAYLMVLDSPPFESGNGWGMNVHRWRSVTPADVASGDTWGKKIVINNYPTAPQQEVFTDDKNTFAVNNAGADRDGTIGKMIACWGQNITVAIKQQEVCTRSADGGKSWSPPQPISGGDQLVIGVDVVADPSDPNRFYATWLSYAAGVAGAPDTYWFAQTLDGGMSWSPPQPITTVNAIPSQFPGQNFRNLSIPIMAVGPTGDLYITYAEYRDAKSDTDEDGMQADVMLITSTTQGVSWSTPQVVNQADGNDADQFQPTVAVSPSGQLNIAYFDRRNDPDNYYIDTYLSRSNDAGETFTDVRVSHDMWDPAINPPTSPSGQFIGDYQGLVADDCSAIPFMNDTHLANAADRDPDFDQGDPRSQFQEVFSWDVPNKGAFGGAPVEGAQCKTVPIANAPGAPGTGGGSGGNGGGGQGGGGNQGREPLNKRSVRLKIGKRAHHSRLKVKVINRTGLRLRGKGHLKPVGAKRQARGRRFSLAPHGKAKVRLKLPRASRRALFSHHKTKVKARVKLKDTHGRKLKLRASRKLKPR